MLKRIGENEDDVDGKRLGEKMEKLANRDRERNGQGEWKAPIDELTKELELLDKHAAKDGAVASAHRKQPRC